MFSPPIRSAMRRLLRVDPAPPLRSALDVAREVEEVLAAHPKVMEVAVAGIPDARTTEAVKTWIVLQPGVTATAEEMQNFCKEKLTGYKVPRYVEFRSELPKSTIGKVLRRELVKEELEKSK